MNFKFTDISKPDGILSAYKVYRDARRELVFRDCNLIVQASRIKIIQMLYLAGQVSDPIQSLRVGSGGTIDPQGLYAKTPLVTQTGLNMSLATIAVTAVLSGDATSITFLADLDDSTGNGSLISEAGLFTASGSMFNVKNFPGIPKTSDFGIHFEWEIRIA